MSTGKPELLYIGDATDRDLWQKDERLDVSKKQQVLNILADLEKTITPKNADIGINILNWAKEKIVLAENESKRQCYLQRNKADTRNKPRIVKYGCVYGCNLGKNIGSEQNGKSRPDIVLQKNNPNSPTVIVAEYSGVRVPSVRT